MRSLFVGAILAIAASCAGTTSPSSTASAIPGTSTTALPAPVLAEQVVYLLIEGQTRGPYVAPVLVAEGDAPLDQVLAALPSFPAPAPSLSSRVPPQTRVLSASVSNGVATVDLSADFATSDGAFSENASLAQLVYTATRSPQVDAVRLLIEGDPPAYFTDSEIDFSQPITRQIVKSFQGAVLIEEPSFGARLGTTVRGEAAVLGSLEARVTDAEGALVATVSLLDSEGDGSAASFNAPLSYLVLEEQSGTVEVFLVGNGSVDSSGPAYRVQLNPPVSLETSCSAGDLNVVIDADPSLPQAVDATRMAIIDAASSCDFATLGSLASQAPFFTFSFGGGEDPARFWAQSESLGSPVTRRMVQLLQGAYSVEPATDDPLYIWPRVFFATQPTDQDWAELADIYSSSEIGNFIEAGEYLGLRLGIGVDATWRFAVTGD
ncbi:MAG: GerMN domain-containing protein [Acidimicrobiia bacterium]|nr:GerMN domain-containing protein [Acidimicrobiia bacterium]MDH3470061.1 GerMN domain-containing protein [Acidimicrobiia bacterium]